MRLLFLLFVGALVVGCDASLRSGSAASLRPSDDRPSPTTERAPLASPKATPVGRPPVRDADPVRVERLRGSEEPAMYVLRGKPLGAGRLVFLHGMCGHPLGYAQAFQRAAAEKGRLLAPQADVVCGEGPGAKWSKDLTALDARITAAFLELGDVEPIDDICVIGMSQGATRAAALARTFPERYTRLVSMGAPTEVNPSGLKKLRAAVLMVGERERKDLLLASERALARQGIPTTSLIIAGAEHAALGADPEGTMDEALDWLWAHSRP